MRTSINYQRELEKILSELEHENAKKRLLLHSCCAPCSSYCLVYLRKYFDITCLYYNPNITDEDEYNKRVRELERLINCLNSEPIDIGTGNNGQPELVMQDENYLTRCGHLDMIFGDYDSSIFFDKVRKDNLAQEKEGGKRCKMCFDMRLSETYKIAAINEYDYFTTSLTISPLKDAQLLNSIGERIAQNMEGATMWLPTDFKKKNGYLLSTKLCERYDMYRQNYCGCVYSMREQNNE